MASLDTALSRSPLPGLRRSARRSAHGGRFRRIVAWIAVAAALLPIGRCVAVALDSPLLAVVAVGMLFLVGIALREAIGQRRR